jgi:hypothetical protein
MKIKEKTTLDPAANFHGYIALPLSEDVKHYLAKESFSADAIETGNFVAIMALILQCSVEPQNAYQFIEECSQYLGKTASQIPLEDAYGLYKRFKKLIESNGDI